MLMLSRNTGKSIVIGGNIWVTVASVNGQQVRLGIVAPAGVVVDREEIHQRRVTEGTAQESTFHIDDHVRMMADARRYRWLRQHGHIQDAYGMLLALSGQDSLDSAQMDSEIDTALRLEAQQQVEQEKQP
ncbi:carbon storage regulator [Pseudomonas fulva]|uniref:Translational regulator CsrA n=1 Tax=Pseudomonas fulva TaxID=47880 RepID=A0A7S9L954_9PSED|nr:carbon storage regulator [Pseudomonas fulva]MBF8651528.1 carbon storage regulator [Pseudomonas putida]MBA1206570.1 carbon storage regulator [Pseudomonas fulva]MBF8655596.1 carbon storage regulator [Pseudomonas putida]MBI6925682.1 carbon storage regulator [Pseudomonas putida]